jgi:hypothetical protein
MTSDKSLVSLERIERTILHIHGQKVMLDADLAKLYGIPTKALKQAVKRNPDRFPSDFMFELSQEVKDEVVTNCDHLARLKFSHTLPYAFTKHGAVMLANDLNSPRAVEVSVQIVRTFVRLREMLVSHKDLALKLVEMEQKDDRQFQSVFVAIRQLPASPVKPKRPIGFHEPVSKKEYGPSEKIRRQNHSRSEN